MIRRPPRSTQSRSSAASDVYKRQSYYNTERFYLGSKQLLGTLRLLCWETLHISSTPKTRKKSPYRKCGPINSCVCSTLPERNVSTGGMGTRSSGWCGQVWRASHPMAGLSLITLWWGIVNHVLNSC
eukprot:TRINITY_DN2128_c0_g1_i3.p2 TRINITY_DN2128_c0_g1~~TRINITY_DN2128_c0_g1_i3.p2  ORF type:complete len:127 (-),score=19.79 TRINITY_DN2128_c0_g1_i3:945-1325(-)